MKKIIFILLSFSIISNATLIRNSEEVVEDSNTSLHWDDKNYDDVDNDSKSKLSNNFEDAINFCEDLVLDSHDDWRLPNVNELKTIVDISKYNPSIDGNFTNTDSYYYWTSTTNIKNTSKIFSINFGNGIISSINKDGKYNIRCVRFAK